MNKENAEKIHNMRPISVQAIDGLETEETVTDERWMMDPAKYDYPDVDTKGSFAGKITILLDKEEPAEKELRFSAPFLSVDSFERLRKGSTEEEKKENQKRKQEVLKDVLAENEKLDQLHYDWKKAQTNWYNYLQTRQRDSHGLIPQQDETQKQLYAKMRDAEEKERNFIKSAENRLEQKYRDIRPSFRTVNATRGLVLEINGEKGKLHKIPTSKDMKKLVGSGKKKDGLDSIVQEHYYQSLYTSQADSKIAKQRENFIAGVSREGYHLNEKKMTKYPPMGKIKAPRKPTHKNK